MWKSIFFGKQVAYKTKKRRKKNYFLRPMSSFGKFIKFYRLTLLSIAIKMMNEIQFLKNLSKLKISKL